MYCYMVVSLIVVVILILSIVIVCNENQEKDILTAIAVEENNTQLGTTTIKFSQNNML